MKLASCLLAILAVGFALGENLRMVTYEQIENALKTPENWLTYSGDYSGWHTSALTQVDRRNVKNLAMQWIFNAGVTGKLQTTPIVVGGVMFVTLLNNEVYALDARNGRQIWSYRRPSVLTSPKHLTGPINRGVAVLNGRVYIATLDTFVVALDSATGAVV